MKSNRFSGDMCVLSENLGTLRCVTLDSTPSCQTKRAQARENDSKN